MSARDQRRFAPSRNVLASVAVRTILDLARARGQELHGRLGQELGRHLWPSTRRPSPCETRITAWPAGLGLCRAAMQAAAVGAMRTLLDAAAVMAADDAVPDEDAETALVALRRWPALPHSWAAQRFGRPELVTLGTMTWAGTVIPQLGASSVPAAAACCALAGVTVQCAAVTDDADLIAVQIDDALEELALAIPPDLWPSLPAADDDLTQAVATHG